MLAEQSLGTTRTPDCTTWAAVPVGLADGEDDPVPLPWHDVTKAISTNPSVTDIFGRFSLFIWLPLQQADQAIRWSSGT